MQVEAFEEVERAFVHVDYRMRAEPEHKVDYNLLHQRQNLLEPHEGLHDSLSSSGLFSPHNSGNCNNGHEKHTSAEIGADNRTDMV